MIESSATVGQELELRVIDKRINLLGNIQRIYIAKKPEFKGVPKVTPYTRGSKLNHCHEIIEVLVKVETQPRQTWLSPTTRQLSPPISSTTLSENNYDLKAYFNKRFNLKECKIELARIEVPGCTIKLNKSKKIKRERNTQFKLSLCLCVL